MDSYAKFPVRTGAEHFNLMAQLALLQ